MRVFTLGYQGLDVPSYVEVLIGSGVGLVLDVRETPWSRKPGFSRSPLQAALAEVGIQYVHLRSAGNPSSNRKTAKDLVECLRRYWVHLQSHRACLEELAVHIRLADRSGRPACLTCYEKLHTDCHRSVLIAALSRKHRSLRAIHL